MIQYDTEMMIYKLGIMVFTNVKEYFKRNVDDVMCDSQKLNLIKRLIYLLHII